MIVKLYYSIKKRLNLKMLFKELIFMEGGGQRVIYKI